MKPIDFSQSESHSPAYDSSNPPDALATAALTEAPLLPFGAAEAEEQAQEAVLQKQIDSLVTQEAKKIFRIAANDIGIESFVDQKAPALPARMREESAVLDRAIGNPGESGPLLEEYAVDHECILLTGG
jgi:hypothetical protein